MKMNLEGLVVLGGIGALAVVGCMAEAGGEVDGDVGAAALPQIDAGMFNLTQLDTIQAAAWKGSVGVNTVEYWAMRPRYAGAAARTYSGSSQSCSTFESTVCGWTQTKVYRATYTQSTLDCNNPPGAVSPPGGAVSFLDTGSYRTVDSSGAPFAWTYVSGNVEYWGMNQLIPNSATSTQSPLTSPYTSLSNFITTLCAMNPVPSNWFTAYYTELPDFCSGDPC